MSFKLVDLELGMEETGEVVSLVDKGASGNDVSSPRIVLIKGAKGKSAMSDDTQKAAKAAVPTAEQLAAFMEGLRQQAAAVGMKLVAADPTDTPPVEPPMDNADVAAPADAADVPPEEQQKNDTAKRAERENMELRKRVAQLEDEQKRTELRKFVGENLSSLPVADEDLVDIMLSIRKNISRDHSAKIEKALVAVSQAAARSSVYKEFGSVGAGASNANQSEFEALVQKTMDANPKLSRSQAALKVSSSNPELYKRLRKGA